MNFLKKKSIQQKIILLVSSTILVQIVLIIFYLNVRIGGLTKEKTLLELRQFAKDTSVKNQFRFQTEDWDAIKEYFKTSMKDKTVPIVFISAYDANGKFLFASPSNDIAKYENQYLKSDSLSSEFRYNETHLLSAVHTLKSGESVLGKIVVGFSLAQNDQKSREILFFVGLITVVLAIISIIIIIVFFKVFILKNLNVIISDLLEKATLAADSSSEMSNSSEQLAQNSSEQAATLEQINAEIKQVLDVVSTNSEFAEKSKAATKVSKEQLEKSYQMVKDLNNLITNLKDSAGKTSQIIKAIDEIAFQTNLLALNAAVEAARAGQSGLGFAVVAQEIRMLAQKVAEAAKATSAIIDTSMFKTDESAQFITKVIESIELTNTSMNDVTSLVTEIANGSSSQKNGIQLIFDELSEFESSTQVVAATSEESSASSQELQSMSVDLNRSVRRLNGLINGEK